MSFPKRLQELLDAMGWTQVELHKQTGIAESTISRWLSADGNEPKIGSLRKIAAATNCNLEWLRFGHGEMSPIPAPPQHTDADLEAFWAPLLAELEERFGVDLSHERRKGKEQFDNLENLPPKWLGGERDQRISDLLTKTAVILESDTVYRTALASNINAFHKAVEMEGEMKEVKEDLRKMQADMDELKAMIRSLGGVLPEKRDPAANA